MTKKTVTLILIFTIFFSVIAMAVWGKVPETSADIYVTSLVFLDSLGNEITDLNDSSLREKKVTLKGDDSKTLDYIFQVVIQPENATDLRLEYNLDLGDATVETLDYRPLSPDAPPADEAPANVRTYKITFARQTITTLSFISNFSGTRRIKDYLMFVFEGARSSDVIDL